MNYNTFFAFTAATERFVSKVFSVPTAIATAVFIFELACDAYQSGTIVRAWCESARRWWATNHEVIVAEFDPCVQVVKASIAWVFGVERLWSAQNFSPTIESNRVFWADVADDYRAAGNRVVSFVDTYLLAPNV